MRRSPLNPGKPLQRKPLKQTPCKPRPGFTPASTEQRCKVAGQVCTVVECQASPCDPAHLAPRAHGGCEDAACVIALCRMHHRLFDDGKLDLLPHVAGRGFERELAHMQGHYGDPLSVVFRLSGLRWVPDERSRNAA